MRPLFAAALLLCAANAYAQEQPDPSAYPELRRETLLEQIAAEMRRTLRDPGSVNDLTVCPPGRIKMKDGRPLRWTVALSFNAKNGLGGYVGRTYYVAIFATGKRPRLSETVSAGAEGFDGLIANAVAKQMTDCQHVPDSEVRRLVQGE